MLKEELIKRLRERAVDIEIERIEEMSEDAIVSAFTECPDCNASPSEEDIDKAITQACCVDKFLDLVVDTHEEDEKPNVLN